MSGPIVRTGATPEFWKNWETVFGGKKKSVAKPAKAAAKSKAKAKAKAPKPAKKAAKKK